MNVAIFWLLLDIRLFIAAEDMGNVECIFADQNVRKVVAGGAFAKTYKSAV
ncbi:hypothetical protein D3C75_721760 [compost metagenome]